MKKDVRINVIKEVINTTSKILMLLNLIQLIPIVTSLIYKEVNIALAFSVGMFIALLICSITYVLSHNYTRVKSNFGASLAIASFTWIGATAFSALSLYFAGDFKSYLDAVFDSMSGFTTSGLVLINDLDHVSKGVNMWRHIIAYIGGQGIIVLALAILIRKNNGIFKMYVGEGKDEKIFPNTTHTASAIWKISLVYLVIGTLVMSSVGIYLGLTLDKAILHGMWNFMSGWATCGFAPMSQSIIYYHSGLFEFFGMIFMILGSFNFALHYIVVSRSKREIFKNIEIRTMAMTITLLSIITLLSLSQVNTYPDGVAYFRKVVYQIVSANTGTGYSTMYADQFKYQWNSLGILTMILAMMFGGSMSSTAGGIKALRIGVIGKGIIEDIRKTIYSEGTIVVRKFHHVVENVLSDEIFRSATVIALSYIITLFVGTAITAGYGYDLDKALFEVASVTANVGYTIGITTPDMPDVLKMVYIFIMWIARLEFISAFVLLGFMAKAFRRKGVTKIEVED